MSTIGESGIVFPEPGERHSPPTPIQCAYHKDCTNQAYKWQIPNHPAPPGYDPTVTRVTINFCKEHAWPGLIRLEEETKDAK